jgi:hypothetical protein
MTTDPHPDPELRAARRERALRWPHTDLHGYPTVSDEEVIEETLAATPKAEAYLRKPFTRAELAAVLLLLLRRQGFISPHPFVYCMSL